MEPHRRTEVPEHVHHRRGRGRVATELDVARTVAPPELPGTELDLALRGGVVDTGDGDGEGVEEEVAGAVHDGDP